MIVEKGTGRFYLYRHIRLDKNVPFYIGIGAKQYGVRLDKYDRAYQKANRYRYWKNIVNKSPYKVEILLESNCYDFIKKKEIEFIAIYKRKRDGGTLTNLTKGGDGRLGLTYIITEEIKQKNK